MASQKLVGVWEKKLKGGCLSDGCWNDSRVINWSDVGGWSGWLLSGSERVWRLVGSSQGFCRSEGGDGFVVLDIMFFFDCCDDDCTKDNDSNRFSLKLWYHHLVVMGAL